MTQRPTFDTEERKAFSRLMHRANAATIAAKKDPIFSVVDELAEIAPAEARQRLLGLQSAVLAVLKMREHEARVLERLAVTVYGTQPNDAQDETEEPTV